MKDSGALEYYYHHWYIEKQARGGAANGMSHLSF
jgi:hypothetical protein